MTKANEYRRDSDQLVRVARDNLHYALALVQQQPDSAAELIDILLLVIEVVDKLETEATIRNHNIDELLIALSRLRRQRDHALDAEQATRRWMEQVKAELDNYRAKYPQPTPKPPVRPASNEPTEYFQQALPFEDRPSAQNNPSPKP